MLLCETTKRPLRWRHWVDRSASLVVMLLIAQLTSESQSAFASECLASALPRGESHASITALDKIASPYFYFRSFDYSFAILAAPSSVRQALEVSAKNGSKDAKGLLAMVERNWPLTRDTDLFGYVLADSYQMSVVQRVLVDLVEHGDVAVFDAQTGQLIPTISVKRINSKRSRTRVFYVSGKTILLQSIDCIEN